jgi:hypothetical protein|tara:strand:+ start:1107 stop:1211 length:105 start_codon:yes stop_codon:yes gene_type:complete
MCHNYFPNTINTVLTVSVPEGAVVVSVDPDKLNV